MSGCTIKGETIMKIMHKIRSRNNLDHKILYKFMHTLYILIRLKCQLHEGAHKILIFKLTTSVGVGTLLICAMLWWKTESF